MKQRTAWRLAGVAAVLLVAAGTSRAGVQVRDQVFWLGTGDWQLGEQAGNVCLIKTHWDRRMRLRQNESRQWFVSAPTIKDGKGRFLASDPEGRSPTVRLVAKKGPNTRWVFEVVSRLRPGQAKGEEARYKAGPSGFTFRMKLTEGPFKGWYLAAGDPPAEEARPGDQPARRPLKLVRDVRRATVFTYVEVNYFVDHK